MKFKTAIAYLFIIIFCISCKKSKDENAPVITIVKPYENQQFSVPDTITVEISVEDETTLTQVEITLTDENKVPVLATTSIVPQNKKINITVPYSIDDISLTSGSYYIHVRASDGTNIHDSYRTIYLNEVPKELKYIYILTHENSTTIHMLRKTPNESPQQLFDINGDFSSSSASSKFQQFYTCGKIFGDLNAYSVPGNTVAWFVPVVSDPPSPYFNYINYFNNILYVSFYYGYIRGYKNDGSVAFAANSPNGSYPIKLFADKNYLFAEHLIQSGYSRIFGVYYLATGALKQWIDIDYNVVDIFEKDDDNIFIFANKNGQGIIRLYTISENGTWEPHTLPAGKINSVSQVDENNYIIAIESGLYKYQYNNNSLTDYVPGSNVASVKYEPTTSEIYTASGNELKIYDYNSHSFINTITFADSILDFQFIYNRE